MSEPLKSAALRGLGEPRSFLVVDPGGRCGVGCIWPGAKHLRLAYSVDTVSLADLVDWVRQFRNEPAFVACEDYTLAGGRAGAQQAGSKMPSAQGIGMCRAVCELEDVSMFLLPPNCKRAGHQALDAQGRAAYDAARNDHERDVVDLAGFVLREVRR